MSRVSPLMLCSGLGLLLARMACCQELVLVENGQSPYRIVVAVDARMQDYYAAQQLQQHVQEMTDVNSLLTDEWGCRWFTPL